MRLITIFFLDLKKKSFSSRLPLSKDGFFFFPIKKKKEKKNILAISIYFFFFDWRGRVISIYLTGRKKKKKRIIYITWYLWYYKCILDALNLLIVEYCGMSFCILESMFWFCIVGYHFAQCIIICIDEMIYIYYYCFVMSIDIIYRWYLKVLKYIMDRTFTCVNYTISNTQNWILSSCKLNGWKKRKLVVAPLIY